jgi:hypothetical protein
MDILRVTIEEAFDRDSKSKYEGGGRVSKGCGALFAGSRKHEVVPFAGEEQLNVSPTVAAARQEKKSDADPIY